jgi:ParB family chromosome partitioning protein
MAKKKVFSIGSSLSDGLEQTFAAAHNYSSDLRVDVIPLKKIEIDPDNPRSMVLTLADIYQGIQPTDLEFERKNREIESLQSLSNSIENQGIINPVVVYEHNGMYRLIAGERRTLASCLARKTDIQAKILNGKPNELKIRILQWVENIERSDLSLAEKLDNLKKIVDAFAKQNQVASSEVTITDISQLVGCVKSHAMNLKAVLEADTDIKDMIATNQIKSLEKAAVLSNIQSNILRKKAIDLCINGATLKQLKDLLEQDKIKKTERPVLKESPRKAGRPYRSVNLGSTPNLKVARIILDSVMTNPWLSDLSSDFIKLDLDNPKNLSESFRLVIKKLEQIHE